MAFIRALCASLEDFVYLGVVADSLHNQKQPRGAAPSPVAMRSHRPPGCYLVSTTTVPTLTEVPTYNCQPPYNTPARASSVAHRDIVVGVFCGCRVCRVPSAE
eukprot:scaffold99049_cov79-Attheya_sp.AAC.1